MRVSHRLCTILIIFVATAMFVAGVFAGERSITPEMLKHFSSTQKINKHDRAIYNAVTKNNINDLALNRDILRRKDALFSNKIDIKGITNQRSSGRCWLFAGLNIMRPVVMKKYHLDKFEFSQSYLSFYDKLEKANRFYEYIIEFRDRDLRDRQQDMLLWDPIPDGGYWVSVVDLIEKYGCVPQDVFPETQSSQNTAQMNKILKRKLRADAVKLRQVYQADRNLQKMRQAKQKMLQEVYRLLVINFGQPPVEFQWRYKGKDNKITAWKTWTPQQFYKDFVGLNLADYINLFDDTIHPYNRYYKITMSRNLFDGEDVKYVNVGLKKIKAIAIKSIKANDPVWFSADVSYDQDSKSGIMAVDLYDYNTLFDIDIHMSKAQQALFRESTRNHAMVFTGVDLQKGKPVKWLVENSWGADRGQKGFWTMYDSWFDEHVYDIVVKKKYVPADVLKLLKQDPVVLPAWDPMCER